jgi:hypothetical protein
MLDKMPDFRRLIQSAEEDELDEYGVSSPLRAIAAPILLLTAADATWDRLREDTRSDPSETRIPLALAWGPALVAPIAAAAQYAHASRPSPATSAATRILNAAAVGIGLAALAGSLYTARGPRVPSLSPLAFAAAGVLGIILDRHEREDARERKRLLRRANVVERLVPKRRHRVDHIVVHV